MAMPSRTTGLTYDDLQAFPDDNLRRELIDGELFVTPAPVTRHQEAVICLASYLFLYAKAHGGKALAAPYDVYFEESTVLEPDVLFIRAENLERVEEKFLRGGPDIAIEVSSPSTKRRDLTVKREVYERSGVKEYWFVNLEHERIDIYRLEGGSYVPAISLTRSDTLETPLLPGFALAVDEVLGSA